MWSPKNYGGDYMGPMTLQRGLELSRNLMTVRVAQQVGMKKVVEVAKEFGVIDNMGAYLPMALGAGETTLLRMTMAYAMLANGALEITPSLVDRVQDRNGKTVYRHEPRTCVGCGEQTGAPSWWRPRSSIRASRSTIRPRSTRSCTCCRASRRAARRPSLAVLGRPIAGKTGTTNDARDNWFMGSTPDITVGIYIGFDEPRTLGPATSRPAAATPRRSTRRSPSRSSRTSRRRRSASRPACAWSSGRYEGGTIDEVFKPGTEPGAEGYNPVMIDGSTGVASGGDASGGSARRPGLSGTGETY